MTEALQLHDQPLAQDAGGPGIAELRSAILAKLMFQVGKDADHASDRDWFLATAYALRDQVTRRWVASTQDTYVRERKRVYYFSVEFLIGRLLSDSLSNMRLLEPCRQALGELGIDFDRIAAIESDAALGNGGLGRLAACFMESMASIGLAGYGYGIRYRHGLFRQAFVDGWQVERPEDWLEFGNPWEFERPEVVYEIGFGGSVERTTDRRARWQPSERVNAVAYDTPIVGWAGRQVNTLRLWSARAVEPVLLSEFNLGHYVGALAGKANAESISLVLYPDDTTEAGRELRLKQEYFFVAASLQDLLRRHLDYYGTFDNLPEKVAIQLNDTHPALAVPELMRLLVDVHGTPWQDAWDIVHGVVTYTNHTLLPEALESWPVPLMERLLPRHMQIIYELNADFLRQLRHKSGVDDALVREVSLIDETSGRRVRMGHLAFLGARKVNGVSVLHTDLMKRTVFEPLQRIMPHKITAKTNGITPRRWLLVCNPALAELITECIGEKWVGDTAALAALEPLIEDAGFRERFAAAKRANKERLADVIGRRYGLQLDPSALFDVQIKRIHEYKRQLLNILETIVVYDTLRAQPHRDWKPRVKIFAGKAAAAYHQAKLVIKLINDVAKMVNSDPLVGDRLKVIFIPNYNVSLAEMVIPAADLSEQISTAGMEASGTGNMKFALNGAITIGTLDGANVEIREQVGPENIHIFGLTAEEVAQRWADGYDPHATLRRTPALAEALEQVRSGVFSPDEPARFRGLVDSIVHHDRYLVTADFEAYARAQENVAGEFGSETWWYKAARNTARMGWFSSDRTVRDYAEEIWRVPLDPVPRD
ncbi:MAG: glycogen/starch/alpha-glucan phosphorylase [Alphaproteobacteria bacterium]